MAGGAEGLQKWMINNETEHWVKSEKRTDLSRPVILSIKTVFRRESESSRGLGLVGNITEPGFLLHRFVCVVHFLLHLRAATQGHHFIGRTHTHACRGACRGWEALVGRRSLVGPWYFRQSVFTLTILTF